MKLTATFLRGLKEARQKREEAKKQMARGIDPGAQWVMRNLFVATLAVLVVFWATFLYGQAEIDTEPSKEGGTSGQRPVFEHDREIFYKALAGAGLDGEIEPTLVSYQTVGMGFNYSFSATAPPREPDTEPYSLSVGIFVSVSAEVEPKLETVTEYVHARDGRLAQSTILYRAPDPKSDLDLDLALVNYKKLDAQGQKQFIESLPYVDRKAFELGYYRTLSKQDQSSFYPTMSLEVKQHIDEVGDFGQTTFGAQWADHEFRELETKWLEAQNQKLRKLKK